MTSHGAVIDRFVSRGRPLRGANVFADDKHIYSYGTHFPMAFAADERKLFIVNGDTWGSTTSHHQNSLRSVLSRTSNYNQVIVPFSALNAASVEVESVEVIEQGTEINEAGCNTCGIELHLSWSDEETSFYYHTQQFGHGSPKSKRSYQTRYCEDDTHTRYQLHSHRNPEYDPTFKPHDTWMRHLLAPSLLTGIRETWVEIPDSDCVQCLKPKAEHDADGMGVSEYNWKHRYVPTSQRNRDRVYLLSGFDETARAFGGGYFLSQLPHKVNSIEEAFTSLAPKVVLKAIADGKYVKRQGDIFAIPDTTMTTRKLHKIGTKLPKPVMKEVTYYDWNNEPWRTVTEPDEYRIGDKVLPVLEADTYRFHMNGYRPRLLGTNHYATEAVEVVRNNRTEIWVRGSLYHIPDQREPDHKVIKLGKVWHRVYRNTAVGSWSATARSGRGRVD